MGVFTRPESRFWQLYLETTKQKEPTDILIGTTVTQQRESRRLALDRYHQRMNELAGRLYKLPTARPAIRFAKYAETYQTDVIAHRAGKEREERMLVHLVAFFGDDLLSVIDQDRARTYHTARKTATPAASARTINREIDLLKGMLRDAVPKYLEVSPIVGMKRLRIVPPRRRYVSVEEYDQLLAVCEDAEDTALLLIARDGLPRLKDLIHLQHTDRDPHEPRILRIADPKANEPIEMALSDRALAAVDALADNGSKYLLPKFRRAENPRDWPGSVRQRLEYLCRQADVDYGRTKNGVTFHWGTRRSGATDYIRAGKNLKAVQAQGGWKKPNVLLEIYTEISREDKLALVGAPPKQRRRSK
jgi:Phage integrase family